MIKSLDTFNCKVMALFNTALVLAHGENIERHKNMISRDNSGTDRTHAPSLGLSGCHKGLGIGFTTGAALVHELTEARHYKPLLLFRKKLVNTKLLVIDELGSVLVASSLPFDEWTAVFGLRRRTGALFDRLTHYVHILHMNGQRDRLGRGRRNQAQLTD